MAGFTKIFSSILDSTIWFEPWPIKGVWITMLTMADQYGNVHASVPGLAKRATVTIEECEQALAKFLAPDAYSRTPDHEGRRIEVMEGGWHLLNYLRYRDMRDEDARREQNRVAQQKHRMSAKNADSQQENLTVSKVSENVSKKGPMSAQAEAEAYTEKESTPLSPQGGTPGDASTLLPMEPAPKAKRQRKGKYQSEDIAPENAEYLQKVYERIPAEHPNTGEPVHKGPYATAARAFQAIVDAGEASARELMAVGTLYYRAESLGQEWADWANRVWDTRPRAMMQVSTLYGPEKRPYRQLLPVARKLIAQKEQAVASQNAEMGMAS